MNLRVISVSELQKLQRAIPSSFLLSLPGGEFLQCDSVLRLLPGKRLVMRATYAGETVLVKLFFEPCSAKKEWQGYAQLKKTGIKTPALLQEKTLQTGSVLMYEFVQNAQPLSTLFAQASGAEKASLLQQLLVVLAVFYREGIYQQDLHLGNFLWDAGQVVALDPASCQVINSSADMLDNLALLLVQLPFADWGWASAQIIAQFDFVSPRLFERRARERGFARQQAYMAKVMRDCTDVADVSVGNLRILCRRDYLTPAFERLLKMPLLLQENVRLLKAGNSATVGVMTVDDRPLVVKYYRDKDALRKVRRLFRRSRAARSWCFSHGLMHVGIDVAAPVALVEQRCGSFVSAAWFVSAYVEGDDLLSCWEKREPTPHELAAIASLFQGLANSRILHGDMKASNLISTGEKVFLIDFDGAKIASNQAMLARDKHRFLRNWDNPPLIQSLSGILAL